MRRVALDTNVLIGLLGNPEEYAERLADFDEIVLCPVVLGEFRAGLFDTKAGRENRKVLDLYLRNPSVRTSPMAASTAMLYAKIFQALKAKGRPIPTNDMWIAACALDAGVPLATDDNHFSSIPMLQLI